MLWSPPSLPNSSHAAPCVTAPVSRALPGRALKLEVGEFYVKRNGSADTPQLKNDAQTLRDLGLVRVQSSSAQVVPWRGGCAIPHAGPSRQGVCVVCGCLHHKATAGHATSPTRCHPACRAGAS
jgi:hypothetical protein